MQTLSLYGPVGEDIPKVEACLQSVADVESPFLAELVRHVLSRGGKRLRPVVTLLAGSWHRYDLDLLVPMAAAMELLHSATLVHDDIVDRANVRRGRPTVNHVWSGGVAILLGDYLFAKSADLVASTQNLRVMTLFARTLMTICQGEIHEVFGGYAGNGHHGRDSYYARINGKTASLFATAAESGALLSGAPEEEVAALRLYGYNLGMAFQIVDDILDFTGEASDLGKPVGNDLLQGTVTLPAILFLERYPDETRLARVLAGGTPPELIQEAVTLIRNSPAIDQAYEVAREFCRTAREALSLLPDGESRRALAALTLYVLERRA